MEKARAKYNEDSIAEWTAERLRIEAEEPQILRILDIMCHNEIAKAIDSPDLYHVPLWQRCIAHFANWKADHIRLKCLRHA